MKNLVFLKLGGSLITDKLGVESVREKVLSRIAAEIKSALEIKPDTRLLLGHGSGSFGHVAAAEYGTRQGVNDQEQWYGFASVSSAVARLNAIVREAMLAKGIPAVSLQPSASAECRQGQILKMSTSPIKAALLAGLVPLVYGDVSFDSDLGGTIISTEEIMIYLAAMIQPSRILLAGTSDGVLGSGGLTIPIINRNNYNSIKKEIGGSYGTDVTGGMASKVASMLDLVEDNPYLSVQIFSGVMKGTVKSMLIETDLPLGTTIRGI